MVTSALLLLMLLIYAASWVATIGIGIFRLLHKKWPILPDDIPGVLLCGVMFCLVSAIPIVIASVC